MKEGLSTDYPKLFEMSKMIGYYTFESLIENMHFSGRSLSFSYDLEVLDIKNKLISIIKEIIGLNLDFNGYVLNSGSDCNEAAMILSRNINKKNTVVCSNISHTSIENRARKIGVNVIKLDVCPKTFNIDYKKLEQIIKKNKDISLIVLTGPTTQIGNYECIFKKNILKLIKKENIRIHIDNVPGILPNVYKPKDISKRFIQEDYIDTISVAPQKAFSPFGCSVLLYKKKYDGLLEYNSSYFKTNLPFGSTCQTAFPMSVGVYMYEKEGLKGLRKISKKCIILKNYLIDLLKDYISPINNVSESNIISFYLPYSVVDLFYTEMLLKGYKIYPLKVEGKFKSKKYKLGGFSVCLAPRKTLNKKRFLDFSKNVKIILDKINR